MKKKMIRFLITIIIIIIILLLLYFIKFGKIEENILIPTGNVDVFDIDVRIDCKCDKDEKCVPDKPTGRDTDTDENYAIPTWNEEEDIDVIGRVFMDDDNGEFIYQQNLKIFTNPAFEYTNKIAPGSTNSYYFSVHNSTNQKLKYYLNMFDQSEYKVNLKYRLRRNNKYVVGDNNTWVSADKVITDYSNISSGGTDSYILDWKWFDDDVNDTIAGEKMTSEYKLNIRTHFEVAK
jgi:hypothetical protein